MKWIIVAIVATIVPYTFLTLRYRKTEPAFRPYEDMKNRANVSRLLAAGFQRVTLKARQPADASHLPGGASVMPAVGGLPDELRTTLVEVPLLAAEIRQVTAAPTASVNASYSIELACTLADDKRQLSGAELYLRPERVVILPTFEPTAGNLATRSRDVVALLTIPAGTLKAGSYMVTVVGEKTSRSWPLAVSE